ncbi:gamma-tubulin complex component 6-like [Pollicipes pollicipes]|uniref:gamma-tubulin complex component 6-like n=1 Tax=Pollicipes pollicipes TaxID=41117 RepID=UPI00188499DD|nr:gamma-tubulin complex component 6-like [Pollicipes pollicipes]
MGLDTASFPFDAARGTFRPAAGLCTERCSPEALAARCGRAFTAALEPCLRGYRCALLEVRADSLAEFGRRVQPLVRLMALLADVCCVGTSDAEMPQKMALVSDLYERLIGASEPTEWAMLTHLFQSTVSPYLRFLTGWLMEGICRDPYDEFPVREVPEAHQSRDETFWTSAFQPVVVGTDNDHPQFLKDLSGSLYQCGRSLSLLRLCDPDHPLSQAADERRVRLAFSLPQLRRIHQQVVSYEAEMQTHLANTLARHLEQQQRQRQELEAAASAHRQLTVSSIQA